MKTILGRKVGMTQVFSENGEAIPVTVVEAGPVVITQIKTVDADGYNAVQIGFEDKKESRMIKPEKGHFLKNEVPFKNKLTEVLVDSVDAYQIGQEITVADFEPGKKLDVTGTSKGKGTQGNIKRHGHSRGPMSHGSKHHRLAGALSGGSYPGRVFKGNHGPGRMGHERTTVQNVELVKVIPERNLMLIKGAIPGPKKGLVKIRYAIKGQGK